MDRFPPMTHARFDPAGELAAFMGNIEFAIADGARSLLLLACDGNGFSEDEIGPELRTLPLPVFGGIFPGILFGRKHYDRGSLVVPFPFEARVANIANLDSTDRDFSELVSPYADQLSSCPTVFIFVDGSAKRISAFLDGVYDLLGTETKYLGGGAGSPDYTGKPCLFSNLGLVQDHAQLVGIPHSSEIELSQGWQKLAGPFLVTESDGRTLRGLDYKPATDTYLEVVEEASRGEDSDFFDFFCGIIDAEGGEDKRNFQAFAKNYPIGIEQDNAQIIICEPVAKEGKSIVCRGNIPPLSPLYVLKATPESLIDASRNAAKRLVRKLSNHNPDMHPLVFSCIGRSHYLQGKFTEEVGEIADAFENGIMGALALGQIANGSDGCLSLFNRSIVLGMPSIERETRSQKAVNLVSMQHALAMLVVQSTDIARLLRHFLSQAIRLVNCRSAHVWLSDQLGGEGLTHRCSYPSREYERFADYPRLMERIAHPLNHMEIITENTAIFHLFPIGKTGVLVMRRNSTLPDELVLALSPAIERLEEACLFAMLHAHCERAKDIAVQDALRLVEEIENLKHSGTQFAESIRKLRFILDSIPLSIFWKDAGQVFRGGNRNFAAFSGLAHPDEIIGKTDADMPWHALSEKDRQALASPAPMHDLEMQLIGPDGMPIWIRMNKLPLCDNSGKTAGTLAIFEDISARKREEEDWRLSSSVFESTREGILMIDARKKIINANRAFCELTGYGKEELAGMDPRTFLPELDEDSVHGRIKYSVEKTGSWRGEIWTKLKSGEPLAVMLNICAVKNEAGEITHYVAVFGNITDQKESEKRLENLAHFDPLTNLPNRTLLAEDLRKAILQADRNNSIFALAFLDLDDFKPVNDQHGHETGDRLLIEVAKRLKGALRGEDTVARLGGDEFVLLLTGIKDMSDVEITLARVLADLSSAFQIDAYVLHVSASIGVTVYPYDHAEADALLRHADQAMYLAKQSGRNRFQWFDSKLDLALRAKQEKLSKLRFALERHELALHYQPKINLRTGVVIGLEALIRWQHPEEGLIGPMSFLPLAEQTGLIIDIGNWILEEALGQMSEWIAAGIDFPVSVNVSAAHLKHPDFVRTLAESLARHPELSPSRLEFEILETAALDDLDRVRETMLACQKMGISFSLDDFGTGYSSLAYLKQLPVDTVKVDKSFVHDMKENTEDLSIIEGVISLARIFSRMVIAEGVETSEHGMLLVRLGCDFGQGYGIARPMPPEEVPKWLAQFNAPSVANGY